MTHRIHNFCAGPCTLPLTVLEEARALKHCITKPSRLPAASSARRTTSRHCSCPAAHTNNST